MQSEQGTKLDVGGLGNAVYFPHFYNKLTHVTKQYAGDTKEMEKVFACYEADADRMNVPWMLGEYGIPADAQGGRQYIEDHQRALERYKTGGTAWHYNPTDEDWNHENMSIAAPSGALHPQGEALVHPYPKAVAGTISRFGFEQTSGRFELEMVASGSTEPTVIFMPRSIYPSPPNVEVSAGRFGFSVRAQTLLVETAGVTGPVRVTLQPA